MIPSEQFNILVVDDVEAVRDVTCRLLRSLGYRSLSVAANGRDALRQLEQHLPHLVLLDLEMPVMDGFATLSAIRKGPHAHLPVIMLTSQSDVAFVRRAAELKVSGYVIKPTSPQILGARVSAIQRLAA